MCPNRLLRRRRGFMSDAIFEQTMRRCEESGWEDMQIFLHKEGEPLLDCKIPQRVAAAQKRLGSRNSIGLNTNAMLLDEDMARALLATGLDVIYFSLDGVDAESYGKIRINLVYDTVARNIRRFFYLRDILHAPTKVVMQMLVRCNSSPHIPLFRKQWQEYDCEIYIKRTHSYLDGGHSSLTARLSPTQINFCDDPFRIFVIYVDGKTGLCCWDYNNEYSPGTILTEPLKDLFNNSPAWALREALSACEGSRMGHCGRCARIFGNDTISAPTLS